jgi:eukaryotic-like serine/threonine-protein kinase
MDAERFTEGRFWTMPVRSFSVELAEPMPLSSGEKLGPYEILAPLGKGGMGEVYKARDTRLNRFVAIKTSRAQFSDRFEREAHAIAALNHTNICQLYDVGSTESGMAYLVMEFVEGETLSQRIKAGPVEEAEALRIASQIADAIDAAHEKGITHRDLKPANIILAADGASSSNVKVLDFGLAQITAAASPSDHHDPENSPTVSMALSQPGTILGTAAYMSPEQARGLKVDKRTDIWAYGVILFEMLTGKPLFAGETITDIIAAVVKNEPDFTALPLRFRELVRACLEKDPKQRLRDAGDAKRFLSRDREGTGGANITASAPSQSRLGFAAWGVAALFLITSAALAFVHFREARPEQHSVRFQIAPPEKTSIPFFRLSPDGRTLAFVTSDRRLWVRSLDTLQAQPLAGTEGAALPFWSPDSHFIGFFAQSKLKKIAASGGPVQILCDTSTSRGGTWNRDGTILFAPGATTGLYTVSEAGGVPVQLTKRGNAATPEVHRYPEFLPDGRHFVYNVSQVSKEPGVYLGSLDDKPSIRLLPDPSNAIFAANVQGQGGHLFFRRGDTLMAQPFNPTQLRLSGDAFPVAEGVGAGGYLELGQFSIAENATLIHGAGTLGAIQLMWMDRAGKPGGLFGPPGPYLRYRLAPDEKRIVFDDNNTYVGVLDSVRGVASRLTFGAGANNVPMWSPDGLQILFSSNRNGGYDVYRKSAFGTGLEELVFKMGTANGWAEDWSKDGKYILYQMPGEKTGQDLWIAPQPGGSDGGKPFPYLQTQFEEQLGHFSPDGKWVAYVSNESGRDEIYVQSFPLSSTKVQVSTGGGTEPLWRSDGKELFFLAADQMLMAVPVTLGRSANTFQAGVPKPLISVSPAGTMSTAQRSYAVSNDGQRFLVPDVISARDTRPLTVVLNWQAGLKK